MELSLELRAYYFINTENSKRNNSLAETKQNIEPPTIKL